MNEAELQSQLAANLSIKNRGHQHQPTMVGLAGVQPDAVKIDDKRKSASLAAVAPAPSSSSNSAVSSQQKKDKAAMSYAAERVIGNGSFGAVYQACIQI